MREKHIKILKIHTNKRIMGKIFGLNQNAPLLALFFVVILLPVWSLRLPTHYIRYSTKKTPSNEIRLSSRSSNAIASASESIDEMKSMNEENNLKPTGERSSILTQSPRTEIRFTVYGEPEPLARHRSTSSGHMYNPSSKLQSQFAEACLPFLPTEPLEGPLEAKLYFYFSRPRYHYRQGKNSHMLKDDADYWHWKRKDLDNLIKFVLDSLNKKAYVDDGQICIIQSAKLYTDDMARTEIVFRQLNSEEDIAHQFS